MHQYAKRLIEVDLPITRISAHSRREKVSRSPDIADLHIWWARRPLSACRAVACAALWPDPCDDACSPDYLREANNAIVKFIKRLFPERLNQEARLISNDKHFSIESAKRWEAAASSILAEELMDGDEMSPAHRQLLREALLDFIADFANPENASLPIFLDTCRSLTQAASSGNDRLPGTRPIVLDPFAGGGSIPFESLRVGADAFGSDINPIAVLLNRFALEYVPTFGEELLEHVREWSESLLTLVNDRLADIYPNDENGHTPIAYLWARTIRCEGPGCGMEVPILLKQTISTKPGEECAISITYLDGELQTSLLRGQAAKKISGGTNRRSSVTCPACGYTTKRTDVEKQANETGFGYHLTAVCYRKDGRKRFYREPTPRDLEIIENATRTLEDIANEDVNGIPLLPSEELPYLRSIFNVRIYGIDQWQKIFHRRQLLSAVVLVRAVRECAIRIKEAIGDGKLANAVIESLALAASNSLQFQCNITTYPSERAGFISAFIQGQSLPMKMDFVEVNPLVRGLAGGLEFTIQQQLGGLEYLCNARCQPGTAVSSSALTQILPSESVDCLITDPPYYDLIPFADCSDFFYVWLRRMLVGNTPFSTESELVPKADEIAQLAERNKRYRHKTKEWFEERMAESLRHARDAVKADGIAVILFAHKETRAWEAMLKSVLDAGWVVTSSWPIDTENANRMRASGSATLSSTVHIVCRPRETPEGKLREETGEWRDVLGELPNRIRDWLTHLADHGVVGADAIFACLGPALEVFSRYSRVEKASGDSVLLGEYLEHVWAAVATEALSMIFHDADAAGLEPDARLTAMWLWTIGGGTGKAGANGNAIEVVPGMATEDLDEEPTSGKPAPSTGFALEFDAARKIAQGLGVHLEQSDTIVEVKGDTARLLPVGERLKHLFGKDDATAATRGRRRAKAKQRSLFEELDAIEAESSDTIQGELKPQAGETVLDRVHQSMILFGSGRGEALRRFMVDDGAGKDARFWKLAQSLSALYPPGTDEKRWVDGVLARKKGLGL